MRLSPDHVLAPATIEAIRDLFPAAVTVVEVDDADLRRLALGIVDAPTRQACAAAILASPGLGARLLEIHRRIGAALVKRPSAAEAADLSRLAVFAADFDARDAAETFPGRFADGGRLRELAELSWLNVAEVGRDVLYSVPRDVRSIVPPLRGNEAEDDAGWAARLVDGRLAKADAIDRTLSEGRWQAGSEALARELPNLSAAWSLADDHGSADRVEAFARRLAIVLMETARWEEFDRLIEAGYRAADRIPKPALRTWLLSIEGAGAARRGRSERARALWSERLDLSRDQGNLVAEADTMLDLAALSYEEGDFGAWAAMMDAAEPVVERAGRSDYLATLWSERAVDGLRRRDLDEAASYAERAMAVLSGADGVDFGFFVRLTSAKTLIVCGHHRRGLGLLASIIEWCLEGGRAVQVARALEDVASAAETMRDPSLALASLSVARDIHGRIGTRHAAAASGRLAALAALHPDAAVTDEPRGPWEARTAAILTGLARLRETAPA